MEEKDNYKITTITTIISAAVFLIVTYFRTNKLDFLGLVVFAIVFWIIFFLVQKQLSEK